MDHGPAWRVSELKRAFGVISSSSALILETRKLTCLSGSGRAPVGSVSPRSPFTEPTGSTSVGHIFCLESSVLSCRCAVVGEALCGPLPLGSWLSNHLSLSPAACLTALCLSLSFFICRMETVSGLHPRRAVIRVH